MVKLVQLKCSQGHCVMAVAYEEGGISFAQAEKELRSQVRVPPMNPWCGICGGTVLHCEDGTTGFKTLKEAQPALMLCMAEQIAARMDLDEMGATYDKRRLN
jgi:hypothetical protein